MKTLKLRDDFYWAGIVDDTLRVFDIIMYTEFGTTYNSYVLKSGGKVILFETVKEAFFEEWMEKLGEVIDVTKIDYLVVNHTEPDHAGSVQRLLNLSPQLKIISTACAAGFLKEIVNGEFCSLIVHDNETMKIGEKTLRFLLVPNLHWPDTMYTFIEEEQVLVTCDSFGSHYGFPDVLVSKVTDHEGYMRATKYYFNCIIGPFKPFMLKALKRVRELDVSMICPGHGPVLDSGIDFIEDTYERWCTVINPNQKKTVIIPYVSAYGYTKQIAEKIAEGIKASGDIDVRSYDMVTADQAKVLEEIEFADGILFGTPTIVGEALKPIWDLTTSIFAGTHGGKMASAFGSYGWSGEGVPHIMERLKQLRMNTVDGLRIRFRPGDTDLVDAFEYGYNFGSLLQDKKTGETVKGSRRLVKCLVCGEIFDSSLEVCPVCGVGRENFVPVEEKESTYRKDGDEFYVILGNGTAGLNAAKAIRERDKTSSILMVSEEKYPTYNRPMLTKALNAGLEISQIQVEPKRWYEENQVAQILGKKIVSVDKEKKEVVLEDGMRLKYTKLIYALGAKSFVPPIPGSEKQQVAAIRTLEDAGKIERMIPKNGHAVVIGGGVLGLEAAWELKKAGCGVTVLEAAPVLMGRQLDEGAAAMLKTVAESAGIMIRTGVKIEKIKGQERVTAVCLADGEEIAADLVLISCGVRANTELAEKMGLRINRAVVADEKMQTSERDIYACGDCVEFEGENAALWSEASEQGKVAGANAAGECVTYQKVQMPLSFNGMNTSLYAIGDNGRNKNLLYKTLEICDRSKKQYEKLYFLNGKLCGVILIGNVSKMAKLTKLMERKATFAEVILDKETESY